MDLQMQLSHGMILLYRGNLQVTMYNVLCTLYIVSTRNSGRYAPFFLAPVAFGPSLQPCPPRYGPLSPKNVMSFLIT